MITYTNYPFLLNEHGDPRLFFQVFAENSLIKTIFEDEKKFDSGTRFFLENISQLGVFWPKPGLQANHVTVRKSAIFQQPPSLNEAILFMSINEALLSR